MSAVGRRIAAPLGLLWAWSAPAHRLAEACSVCIGPGSEERGLTAGFYWSALLLTALPFALAGLIGVWLRRATGRLSPPSPPAPGLTIPDRTE